MKKILSRSSIGAAAAALFTAALTACGGAEGPQPSISMSTLQASAGDVVDVAGSVTSSNNLLTSMSWTAVATKASAPSVALINGNCVNAQKNDAPLAVKGPVATGSSEWSCSVGVITPTDLAEDMTYNVSLIGVDDRGVRHTAVQQLLVKKNPAYNPNASYTAAGKDFTVTMGQTANMHCDGATTSTYQWAILDNGGLPLVLAGYTGSDTSFTAPAVKADTKFTFQCRETDATTKKVKASSVTATVSTNTLNTLVAKIASAPTAAPGTTVNLSSEANWYGPNGSSTSGPLITSTWSIDSSWIAKGYRLLSNTGSTTQLFVPTTVSAATFVPVTLTATSGQAGTAGSSFQASSSSYTQTVRVDPFGSLTPSVTLSANGATIDNSAGYYTVASGVVGSATANFGTPTGTTAFYRWKVVSGANILKVASVNTATIGFIAPIVAAQTEIRIQVDMAYGAPVDDTTNPAVYSTDVLLIVKP